MIESFELTKRFDTFTAVQSVSLTVQSGEVLALLGPNGAGKTTFIKILATLLRPTHGSVEVLGHDVEKAPHKVRERISLAGQNASVDEELTGSENLYLVARLLGIGASAAQKRVDELLSFFSLKDARNRLVKHYSGGMRRRLDIAASIVKTPDILFLDEPTTGLDPRSRNRLWNVIREIAKGGTTVVLTTQYLDEADQLADRITVVDEGRIVSDGTADELKASVGKNVLHLHLNNPNDVNLERVADILCSYAPKYAGTVSIIKNSVTMSVSNAAQSIEILTHLESENVGIKSYSLSRPSLDEVFLALTGDPKDTSEEKINTDAQNVLNGDSNNRIAETIVSSNHAPHHASMIMDSIMLGWRSLLKVKHIPEQFVDVLITPVMFTFMFAFLLGGALAGSVDAYLAFLVPGMLVQTLTFNSVYSGMNIHTDISKGIFDRFKSMPIWSASPFFGLFVGDCLRHVISGIFLLIFSMIIGFRFECGLLHITLALFLMIVFALSMSWLFLILALVMRSLSAVMSTGWMILMPLVFLSNIYASPETMPQWLQHVISFNPVTWQVDAARILFAGQFNLPLILKSLASSLTITIALAPIAVRLYQRER